MFHNRVYSFIGLAKKAGRLVAGGNSCQRKSKAERVYLMIVAEDASENTKKKVSDMCRFRQIDMRVFGSKELLGKSIGRENSAVIGIMDKGFAEKLVEMIDNRDLQNGGGQYGEDQNI